MSSRLTKIITILLAPLVFTGTFLIYSHNRASNVRAFGHIVINLGVPSGQPIFTIDDFMPGDCEIRNITVTNNDTIPIELAVRSDMESETKNISQALSMHISEGLNEVFSESLQYFFTQSAGLDGIYLSTHNPGDIKTYTFKVCFNKESGNEYQEGQVIFDLIFGEIISPLTLPAECSHLKGIITQKIEGTSGKDRIRATSANELIIGNGGNDDLDGGSGLDCVVGGNGNDKLDGGSEEDVVLGFGGNDDIKGGSANDFIYGGEGKDKIDGGAGEDKIYAGPGDDNVDGQSGNDYIDGETGTDKINGGSGQDKCINGENISSCEL